MKLIEVCANLVGCSWLNEYHANNDSVIVFPLYLCLDIGKFNASREEFLKGYMDENYINSNSQVESFLKLLDKDVGIRIWSSQKNADDYLLVYYICNLLKNKNMPVSVIYTTDYNEYAHNVAQLTKEEFFVLFDYEKRLSTEEVNQFALKWEKLVEENAELRVCVDRTVVSKSYGDYDEIILSILKQIEEEDGKCTKIKLVGWLMGQEIISDMSCRMGIFLVNCLIENGKIKIVNHNVKEYLNEIALNA